MENYSVLKTKQTNVSTATYDREIIFAEDFIYKMSNNTFHKA